jgi:hypothetical protein
LPPVSQSFTSSLAPVSMPAQAVLAKQRKAKDAEERRSRAAAVLLARRSSVPGVADPNDVGLAQRAAALRKRAASNAPAAQARHSSTAPPQVAPSMIPDHARAAFLARVTPGSGAVVGTGAGVRPGSGNASSGSGNASSGSAGGGTGVRRGALAAAMGIDTPYSGEAIDKVLARKTGHEEELSAAAAAQLEKQLDQF